MLLCERKTPATSACNSWSCSVLIYPQSFNAEELLHTSYHTRAVPACPSTEPCAVRVTNQSPNCTGAPRGGQSLRLEPSILRPAQLRQHKSLPKLPLASTSNWQFASRWNSSCTVPSELDLSRSSSSNVGSRRAANWWDFKKKKKSLQMCMAVPNICSSLRKAGLDTQL